MSSLDDTLEELRNHHRATARYTVYKTAAGFTKVRSELTPGLDYDSAVALTDRLNKAMGERRFGDAMYLMELEKPAKKPR